MSAKEIVKKLEERIAELEDELYDAQHVPWPEWANSILKKVRSYSGYDGYDDATDGVDIVGEVDEALSELYSEGERLREKMSALTTHPEAGKGDEVEREAAFLLDRLSELEWSDIPDDFWRDWNGHVEPSLARLRAALKGSSHDQR